jgi:hypothetical protein
MPDHEQGARRPRIPFVKLTPEQERKRRISVAQAAELRNLSVDTFRRHFPHLIRKDTPRRDTCRLGDVLDIGES